MQRRALTLLAVLAAVIAAVVSSAATSANAGTSATLSAPLRQWLGSAPSTAKFPTIVTFDSNADLSPTTQ
jgi:hypothetical protein